MGTKFTLSLEQLDKRDMPSVSLTRPPIYTAEVKFVVPEGCWPGPQPSHLGGADATYQKTAPLADAIVVDPVSAVTQKT